ncbi:hypothetical protein B5M44_21990 [Shinella sumterensis]|uniref:hypothetical protein n=1 Tax=Shinella sumterensis TaxID=1967501 RepID=UPI00106EB655|nr:hypothetical protein [Shinella sumterensis]MCD1266909.1 hypothetical protein [Shinella sumterensis]TFE95209.1 hypothetical protein B5M44_21990 [Shinella sumterensis]
MTKKIEDGGPAFSGRRFEPQHGGSNDREPWNPGMSLRDWFAGQVLAGFMSAKPMHFNPDDDAAYCYRVADAMLSARKVGSE